MASLVPQLLPVGNKKLLQAVVAFLKIIPFVSLATASGLQSHYLGRVKVGRVLQRMFSPRIARAWGSVKIPLIRLFSSGIR